MKTKYLDSHLAGQEISQDQEIIMLGTGIGLAVMGIPYSIGRTAEVINCKIQGEEPTGLPAAEYFDLMKCYLHAGITGRFPEKVEEAGDLEKRTA